MNEKKSFIENKHRISKTPKIFEMDRYSFESIDIDRESDWDFVEKLMRSNVVICKQI